MPRGCGCKELRQIMGTDNKNTFFASFGAFLKRLRLVTFDHNFLF
jgi:hypothetical protein